MPEVKTNGISMILKNLSTSPIESQRKLFPSVRLTKEWSLTDSEKAIPKVSSKVNGNNNSIGVMQTLNGISMSGVQLLVGFVVGMISQFLTVSGNFRVNCYYQFSLLDVLSWPNSSYYNSTSRLYQK